MKQIAIALICGLLTVPCLADEPMCREYQTKLQAVIQQHHPDAKVEKEDNRLVYRFHTQTFKIHAVNMQGHIYENAHDEEGPNVDGILVRVSLREREREGESVGQAVIPQTIRRPYWQTFINVYPVSASQNLWVSISFGTKTDKNMLDDLLTCFDPVLPLRTSTKNQKLEKPQQRPRRDK